MSRSFKYRVVLTAGLIIALFFIIWLDFMIGSDGWLGVRGVLLMPIGLIAASLGAREVVKLQPTSDHITRATAIIVTAIVFSLACLPNFWLGYPENCPVGRMGWPLFGLAAAIGVAFIVEMIRYDDEVDHSLAIQRIGIVIFATTYVGVLLGFGVRLRDFASNGVGMTAVLSLLIPVKLSDIFAYCGGKLMGRTKLWPNLSPGKTIEGTLFGLIGGIAGASLVFYVIGPFITGQDRTPEISKVIIFGLCITIAGMLGDLSESLLKRGSGKKNSSSWLPGLGGILDILDSLLAAAPVAWAFWVSGLIY
jgi:phosphatidate cytidylyltransferase